MRWFLPVINSDGVTCIGPWNDYYVYIPAIKYQHEKSEQLFKMKGGWGAKAEIEGTYGIYHLCFIRSFCCKNIILTQFYGQNIIETGKG